MDFLNNKEVGERLKKIREAKKWSVRKFASEAEVDQSQLNKIEKGELPITKNILDKLVSKYRLERNYILFGTDVPRETKFSSIPDSQFIKSTIDRMLTDREKALAVIEEMAAYLIKTGYNIGNKHATEDLDEEKNKTGSKAGLTNH